MLESETIMVTYNQTSNFTFFDSLFKMDKTHCTGILNIFCSLCTFYY